jgi:hypothetical protein
MTDRSPGRGAAAPGDGPCSATPRRGVKNAPAAKHAPRPHAPLVTTPPPPPAAAPRPPAAPAAARDLLVALATQGAYVLLLDRETGAPLCEPTRDPAAIARAWDAHRHYAPRPALVATKRSAAVQPPADVEVWWPPRGWRPGVPVVDLPPAATTTPTPPPSAAPPPAPPPAPSQVPAPAEPTPAPQDGPTPAAATPGAEAPPPTWVTLHPTSGRPVASFSNAIEYLRAACGAQLWLNTMSGVAMLAQHALSDTALGRLRDQAERRHGVRFGAETLGEAARVVAEERPRSPVQEYLRGLRWDGTPRLAQLAAQLCAHPPTALDLAIVRCFAIQAVARALEPGCKADSVLVLHGGQGAFKSTALRALAGPFFSDGELPDNARDQGQLLRLSWIHELAEIDRYIRARDSSTMKAMITRHEDAYRPPYARAPVVVPRSFVLTGTVNEGDFLTDLTGNRRFWVLSVPTKIDLAWITAHRDQIWAEAGTAYERERRWWFDPETEQASAQRNAHYLVHDDLDDLVAQAVEHKATTTVIEVCTAILSRGLTGAALDQAALRARSDKSLQNRVAAALKRLRWEQRWQRIDGKPTRLWTPQ